MAPTTAGAPVAAPTEVAALADAGPRRSTRLGRRSRQGKVRLHTSAYPLDAVNDAMADLDQGRLQARGILAPAA